jgi:NAD(P)H-hydrate epimerase
MQQTPLNRHWVREVDRRAVHDYGMSSLVLMENAARGAADVLLQVAGAFRAVAIVCGKGNNAGDGLAMARHLDSRGTPSVHLLLLTEPAELTGDALANFQIVQRYIPYRVFGRDFDSSTLDDVLAMPEVIVDALLGTGATGNPRPPLDDVIPMLNEYPSLKIALDVPSGLDCDTGRAAPSTFRADHTVTFVAPKPGLLLPEAKPYVGQLHVVDIGVPRPLVEQITRLSQDGV